MKTTSRTVNDVEIISLQGKITIGAGDTQLRETIAQALAAGKNKILLEMSGVTTIDSSGVGIQRAIKGLDVSTVGTRWKLMSVSVNCGQM